MVMFMSVVPSPDQLRITFGDRYLVYLKLIHGKSIENSFFTVYGVNFDPRSFHSSILVSCEPVFIRW